MAAGVDLFSFSRMSTSSIGKCTIYRLQRITLPVSGHLCLYQTPWIIM